MLLKLFSFLNCFRFYQEKDGKLTTDVLYEEWFHCEDLGSQLTPAIKKLVLVYFHGKTNPDDFWGYYI